MKKKIISYFMQKNINKIILFGASALSTTLVSMLNKKQQKKIALKKKKSFLKLSN